MTSLEYAVDLAETEAKKYFEFPLEVQSKGLFSKPKHHQDDINAKRDVWASVDGREREELVVAVVAVVAVVRKMMIRMNGIYSVCQLIAMEGEKIEERAI